jgi:hypothetical protein
VLHDRFVGCVLAAVVALTVLCLFASVTLALFGPSTPVCQQLLATLLSMTSGGFAAVVALLAAGAPCCFTRCQLATA